VCSSTGGYVTLMFYDLFALRHRPLGHPYRVAALGGFTSYAVGHNVGASVFSGRRGALSHLFGMGLSVVEVTKLCFIAGLTFWLGNVTCSGSASSMRRRRRAPSTSWPLWCNRAFGLVLIGLLCAYVAWVSAKPRVIGRDGWQVTLPRRPLDADPDRHRLVRSGLLLGRPCTCWCPTSPISASSRWR